MKRFKIWFFERFLPAYINETYCERIADLERDNLRMRSYIDGMERALRAQKTVQIRNEVK